MTLTTDQRINLYIEQAYGADRASNEKKWIACLWSSRIVGNKKYGYGATIKLADRLGVEVDSVEDYATAYRAFESLCAISPMHRVVVFAARRAPYIHYSHFRVLGEAYTKYNLSIEVVFGYLMDVIQAEGNLSVNKLEMRLKQKHDKELTWEYWGQQAMKAIHKTINQPDVPDHVKAVLLPAYEVLGDQA